MGVMRVFTDRSQKSIDMQARARTHRQRQREREREREDEGRAVGAKKQQPNKRTLSTAREG